MSSASRQRTGQLSAWAATGGLILLLLLPLPETPTLGVGSIGLVILSILLALRGRPTVGVAAVAGAALAGLASPDLPFGWLAFVSLAPLLAAGDRARSAIGALSAGLAAGTAFTITACPWGANAFAAYTESSRLTGMLLYLPLAALFGLRLALLAGLSWFNRRYLRAPALLVLPAGFVCLEALIPSPYPWLLGCVVPAGGLLSQLADVTGLTGLSWLVIAGNVVAWRTGRLAFLRYRGAEGRRLRRGGRLLSRDAALFAACLALAAAYGTIRLGQVAVQESEALKLSVLMVQPASPSVVRRDATALKNKILKVLNDLTGTTTPAQRANLIVFSESAAPMGYQYGFNPEFREFYENLARQSGAAVLADNISTRRGSDGKLLYSRGALLIGPDGRMVAEYLKRRLVPFGEYVPLGEVIPGLKPLFRYVRTYQAGEADQVLEAPAARLVAPICFEVLDPDLVRRYVQSAAGQIIVSQGNDGWYASLREMRQHLELARYRAIENRRPLVRVGNTGLSAAVSATGRLIGLPSPAGNAWSGLREVPLAAPFSFYGRYGPVFSWLCGSVLAGAGLWRWRKGRARRS